MKTAITKLSAILFLLFALPLGTFAAVNFPLYLCGGAIANLKPDATVTAALAVGDRVIWQEFDAADQPVGTATTITVTTAGTVDNFTTPGALSSGAHSYKVFVISAAPNTCTGDVSDPFSLYVLPTATVSLGTPSNANYCEAGGATSSSVVTATIPTLDAAIGTDITFAYNWTATKDGAAVTPVTGVGGIGTAADNVFTLSTTTTGTYKLKLAINYAPAAGVTLKSGDGNGCVVTSTESSDIKVTPKPGKPTVSFS